MKKTLFLLPVALLLLGAGCGASVDTTASVTPSAQAPAPQPAPAADASVVTVGGLSFRLPKDWSVRDVSSEKNAVSAWQIADLNVPDPHWHVTVPLSVAKADEVEIDDSYQLLTTAASGAKIYSDFCAPAIACYVIDYKGSVYAVSFEEPDSDEPPPDDLSGVWFPSTTVTEKQTLDMVASVK